MKKLSVLMLTLVFVLAASTALAAQQSEYTKEQVYESLFGHIKVINDDDDYSYGLKVYVNAMTIAVYQSNKGPISASDPEMAKFDVGMAQIEAKLWQRYEALAKAGKRPEELVTIYRPHSSNLSANQAKEIAQAKAITERIWAETKAAINTTQQQAPPKEQAPAKPAPAKVERVEANGTIRGANNRTLGRIEPRGTQQVVRVSGREIGTIEPRGSQHVVRASGREIGTIEPRGSQQVVRASGREIGTIEGNGTVKNTRNQTIGTVPGMKKEWAAVFFFFTFE